MKWDGYAFPAPEIRERDEHAALQCKRRSISPDEPDTVVNAQVGDANVSDSSTLDQFADLIAEGVSIPQAAARLGLSHSTGKRLMRQLRREVGES